MIRKILKWIGIVLGSLIGLIVLAFATLYLTQIRWNYEVPVETIIVPTDQAAIARGEHIATIHICGYCHTEPLSGQSETVPGFMTLSFPNLTAGAGGVGATNTDEDWSTPFGMVWVTTAEDWLLCQRRFSTTSATKAWARSTPI